MAVVTFKTLWCAYALAFQSNAGSQGSLVSTALFKVYTRKDNPPCAVWCHNLITEHNESDVFSLWRTFSRSRCSKTWGVVGCGPCSAVRSVSSSHSWMISVAVNNSTIVSLQLQRARGTSSATLVKWLSPTWSLNAFHKSDFWFVAD